MLNQMENYWLTFRLVIMECAAFGGVVELFFVRMTQDFSVLLINEDI
jgi:hypothetical protein